MGDEGRAMQNEKTSRDLSNSGPPEAWHIATALNICIAKVVGKYTAYPQVDSEAFHRVFSTVEKGLRGRWQEAKLGDFCQELRAVASCPIRELLRSAGADDTDTRIAAIAQVVRVHAGLSDDVFREILTGLLSWEAEDKNVILEALVRIVRG